jgi:soluble lytic murein transglycosylase-like protein
MRAARIALALLASIASVGAGATQAIYYREDPDGTLVLTDDPGERKFLRYGPAPAVRAAAAPRSPRGMTSMGTTLVSRPFHDAIAASARTHGLDAALLHAIVTVESAYRPTAVSSKGARGLMQLMPATAARYGVAEGVLHDPAINVETGARHLAYLLGLFEGNTALAIAAYNAGEHAVLKYGSSIPPYPETQDYVPKVLKLYEAFVPLR